MALSALHPEDIKAALRKRFGSVAAFERKEGLPTKSVSDVFRGRRSRRVTDAIERAITPQTSNVESDFSAHSAKSRSAHSLNRPRDEGRQ